MLLLCTYTAGCFGGKLKVREKETEKKNHSSPDKYQQQLTYFFLHFAPCGGFPPPLRSSIAVGTSTSWALQALNGAEGRATTLVK